jgi:DNA-binding MarR family transcriptional regulator
MDTEAYRELKALEELAANPTLTQRRLASQLEVALGLTNLMLRRLVKKGYVEVVNTRKNRLQYLITPRGITEKTRLTYEYMEYSLHLYRRVREELKTSLSRILQAGGTNVVLLGTGEIAEIAYLTLKELGLNLVGVVDDEGAGGRFLGFPVIQSEALTSVSFDCGIVSTLNGGLEALQQRLRALGVPDQKIIVIERNRHLIRAITPGLDS